MTPRQAAVSQRIAEEIDKGHPSKQAAAIAYAELGDGAKDMSPEDWRGMVVGLLKFFSEEEREPEHAGMTTEGWKGLLDGLMKFLAEEAAEPQHQAHDRLALDAATVRTYDDVGRSARQRRPFDDGLRLRLSRERDAKLERAGLDADRIYQLFRDPTELKKAVKTADGIQVLLKHTPVTADDHKPDVVAGTTGTDANGRRHISTTNLSSGRKKQSTVSRPVNNGNYPVAMLTSR